VCDVRHWHDARRLFRDGWTKTAIAATLGMSRNTVADLVASEMPPRYERAPGGSMLDGFADAVAAMLAEDPTVPATVVLERLRPLGYVGGITILKERVAKLRPQFRAARSYQRTTYFPGELAHLDWWHTGLSIPVGKGVCREAFGLVATLPHSAAHACVFCLDRTTADFCAALVGCLWRLGGVPAGAVIANDASIVASRRGAMVRLVDEVAALFGQLSHKAVVLRPRLPEGKGQGERIIGYLETSFLPHRHFADRPDLQSQHDGWASTVAFERHPRRLAGSVAEAWRVERSILASLPSVLPVTDHHLEARVSKDGFVRVAGADYSVLPGLAGCRVQLQLSPTEVVARLDGTEVARHVRSFVTADVVVDPRHAQALRLEREARPRLKCNDVAVPAVDLARYDAAVGISP
jgi:transposase